jgi:hypothetical protein
MSTTEIETDINQTPSTISNENLRIQEITLDANEKSVGIEDRSSLISNSISIDLRNWDPNTGKPIHKRNKKTTSKRSDGGGSTNHTTESLRKKQTSDDYDFGLSKAIESQRQRDSGQTNKVGCHCIIV